VTAMIVQDFMGGDILRRQAGNLSHYWNRLPNGEVVDLTFAQFEASPRWDGEIEIADRPTLLQNFDTRRRYLLLKKRVSDVLSSRISA
jgi:hypothetical protein